MKDRITVFSIYITINIPLRFFAFRLHLKHSKKRKSTAKIFTENFEIATKLTTEPENEVTEEDYAVVDDIVVQMHLTKAETEVINCYMSGLGHCEIATILGINRTTVRRRRERVRGKFNNAFVSD